MRKHTLLLLIAWVYFASYNLLGCTALIHTIGHIAGSKDAVDVTVSLQQRAAQILKIASPAQKHLPLENSDFDLLYTLPDGTILVGLVEMKTFGSSWNSFRPEPRSLLRLDPKSMRVLWRKERDEAWPALSQVVKLSNRLILAHSTTERVLLEELNLETGDPLSVHYLPQGSRVLSLHDEMIWYSLVTRQGFSVFRQKWGEKAPIRVGDIESALVLGRYLVVMSNHRSGDGENYVWLYDLSSGAEVVRQRADNSVYLKEQAGVIYLSADQTIYRLEQSNQLVPVISFDADIAHFSILKDGNFVAELFGVQKGDKRRLVVQNNREEKPVFSMELDNRVNSRFVEAFEMLTFTTRYHLIGLDLKTGQEKLRTRLYEPKQLFLDDWHEDEFRIVDDLSVHNGNFVVQSHDAVVEIAPDSGVLRWKVIANQKYSSFFRSLTANTGWAKEDLKCKKMVKPYSSCFYKNGVLKHPDREPSRSPSVNHFEKFKNQHELHTKLDRDIEVTLERAVAQKVIILPTQSTTSPINSSRTSALFSSTSPLAAEMLQQNMDIMQSRLNLTSAGMGAMAAGQALMVETQGQLSDANSARIQFREMLNHRLFGRLPMGHWRMLPIADDLGRGFILIDLVNQKQATIYVAPFEHEHAMDAFINVEHFTLTAEGLVTHGIHLDSANWEIDKRYMYMTTVKRSLLYFPYSELNFIPIQTSL